MVNPWARLMHDTEGPSGLPCTATNVLCKLPGIVLWSWGANHLMKIEKGTLQPWDSKGFIKI